MKPFVFYMPTKVVIGEQCTSALPAELAARGCKHVFFVTEPGIVRAGLTEPILKLLSDFKVTVFDQAEVNPTEKMIDAGAEAAKKAGCDCVVGLGGGSVLDSAIRMPHGLACALCLPPVAAFAHTGAKAKYAHISRTLKHPKVNGDDGRDAALASDALH